MFLFQKVSDLEIKNKIDNLAGQALDRAEELKGIKKFSSLSINDNKKPSNHPYLLDHLCNHAFFPLRWTGSTSFHTLS